MILIQRINDYNKKKLEFKIMLYQFIFLKSFLICKFFNFFFIF